MTTNARIQWDKPQLNNFIAIPRIAMEELDAQTFKLYAHYIDETRWQRAYKKGCRTTSTASGIGKNTITASRKVLEQKGYITVVPSVKPDEPDETVLLTSIWERNRERYENETAQVDYALDVLSGANLTDEQCAALEQLLVSRKKDAGVPEKGQPVPEKGQPCPGKGTESYIDGSLTDVTQPPAGGNAGASVPGPESGRSNPYKTRNVSAQAGKEEPEPTPSPTVTGDVTSHPMVIYLAEKLAFKVIPTDVLEVLVKPIKYRDSDGREIADLCPLIQWDKTPGYSAFVKDRVNRLLGIKTKTPMKPVHIVKNLAKLDFQPADGSKQFPGFKQWCVANRALVKQVDDAPTPVVHLDIQPEPDSPWHDPSIVFTPEA